jgi:hypothetical protein
MDIVDFQNHPRKLEMIIENKLGVKSGAGFNIHRIENYIEGNDEQIYIGVLWHRRPLLLAPPIVMRGSEVVAKPTNQPTKSAHECLLYFSFSNSINDQEIKILGDMFYSSLQAV